MYDDLVLILDPKFEISIPKIILCKSYSYCTPTIIFYNRISSTASISRNIEKVSNLTLSLGRVEYLLTTFVMRLWLVQFVLFHIFGYDH